MFRPLRGLAGGVVLGMLAATAGCGWIIGLDEFTDAPPSGGGGGGGCTSPAECPSGEHGTATCEGGACGLRCDDGFADCDDAVGCETGTTADKSNCGGCGVTCSAYCVEGSCNDPVYVAAGLAHACAILKDGSLWCWGAVSVSAESTTQPMPVSLPGAATMVSLGGTGFGIGTDAYLAHTCALVADETLHCWGHNNHGQLGLGNTTQVLTPAVVGLSGVRQVDAGQNHTCAVDVNDRLFCWGHGDGGQIGNGEVTDALSPVQVATDVDQVSAGSNHTCAVTFGGSLRCWGWNNVGQIGNGSQTNQLLPFTVLNNGVEVRAGGAFTCARSSFGAHCWGKNFSGELGINSTTDQATPQPLNLPGVDALAAGWNHSGALVAGEVYMWGDNSHGQLGNDTAIDSKAPVAIGLRDVQQLTFGKWFSCALTKAHEILCWGDNEHGQLGDGSSTGRSVPERISWP